MTSFRRHVSAGVVRKRVIIEANSANPDYTQQYAATDQCLNYLLKTNGHFYLKIC